MEHAFPKSAGAMTECLRDVRFPDAGWSEQQHALALLDETACR